jgi:hypothetical protein
MIGGHSNVLERLRQKEKEASERLAVRAQQLSESVFLPPVRASMRAMPNHLARSSLFAPVAPGRKKIHKDATLVSRRDAIIKFWGEQLDEGQADVWMQAMYEALKGPLGAPVIIKRAAFLRSIGRQTGNFEYKWLHRSLQALTFAMLVIEVLAKNGKPKLEIGKIRALHLVEGFDYHDDAEVYTLRIDPRWRDMYANEEFALIDWEKRLQFRQKQDMAKALQRLAATSNDAMQIYSLDWLKGKLEYGGRMRDFKDALARAMRELERREIVAGARIELSTKGKEQAVWMRL